MRQWATVIACVLMGAWCLAVVGVLGGVFDPSSTTRLARHFDLTDVSSPDAIQSQIEARVPPGTSEADLLELLNKRGIGGDSRSGIGGSKPEPVDEVVAYVEPGDGWFDSSPIYRVYFQLDERRRVRAVRVTRSILRL